MADPSPSIKRLLWPVHETVGDIGADLVLEGLSFPIFLSRIYILIFQHVDGIEEA